MSYYLSYDIWLYFLLDKRIYKIVPKYRYTQLFAVSANDAKKRPQAIL